MHTWLVLQRLKKENKVNNNTREMNDYEIIFIEIAHNCAYSTTVTCFIKIAIKLIAFIYTRNIGDHIKKKKKFSIIKQLTTKKLRKILIFSSFSAFHCWCVNISSQHMPHLIFLCCGGIWNFGSLGMVQCFIDLKITRNKQGTSLCLHHICQWNDA